MPVKTISQLRARFAVTGVTPTEQDYVDLVDTLLYYQSQISSILIPLLPVVVVADEAERLAAGPSLERYRKVKQTDNGRTYVRQQDPGNNPGDWVDIGDVAITIPDVIQLQTQLDRRLTRLGDDATTGQIALHNFYASLHAVDPAGTDELTANALDDSIILAFRDQDFTILPEDLDPDTVNGACDLYVKNVSGGDIEARLQRPTGIDFVFVMDQSGSMADARLLMPDLVRGLEAQLNALDIGTDPAYPNRYAMMEFGSGRPAWPEIPFADYTTFLAATQTFAFPVIGWTEDSGATTAMQSGTTVTISGGSFVFTSTLMDAGRRINWDTAQTAIVVSVTSPTQVEVDVTQNVPPAEFTMDLPNPNFWQEDGYEGIDRAMDMLPWRNSPSVVKLLFLMTDEDRNSAVGEPTYPVRIFEKGGPTWQEQRAYIKQRLLDEGYVIAALHGQKTPMIQDSLGGLMIAMDYTGRCYAADGAGGYTVHSGGHSWPSSSSIYSKYDTADFAAGPFDYTPGQYEDYFELLIDPEVRGYVLDIWEYREQQEPATYANASNTATQVGTTVTITVGGSGGYLFTSTAVDGGRMIAISGGAVAMIVSVTSPTEAEVHITQSVGPAAFSVSRRWWQGYNKNAQQTGNTVTLSSSSTTGFLFCSTTVDAGMVMRFATGQTAKIVSVTSPTEAEVDVTQSVPPSAFLVWPNEAAALTSRSVLSVVVPMLAERIQQELSLFKPSDGVTFPVTIPAGAWRRFRVTLATAPDGSVLPGRKLLIH